MKLTHLILFNLVFSFATAQTTLVFQPNTDCTKDAFINNSPTWNGNPGPINNNYGTAQYLRIEAWTANANGSPQHDSRSMIDFPELHDIQSCDLLQATLVLYANPNITFANGGQAETNDVEIFRIIEPWEEEVVTWLSQPGFDPNIKAEIPQNNNYDSILVDVTELVNEMIQQENSHGFLLKQINEDPYGSMDFASSEYSDPTKAPKLILQAENIVFGPSITEIFSSPDTTLCVDLGGLILNVQDDLASSYLWSNGSTESVIGITTDGEYSVTILYQNCTIVSDTIQVYFQDFIFSQTAFSSPDTFGCLTEPLILDVQNSQAVSYIWSNGSSESSIEIIDAGIYSVDILLNDCTGLSGTIDVLFENCDLDCEVKLANTFTPNGDGVNDNFGPIIENLNCFQNYNLKIFNRWGAKVFSSTDPSESWNGKQNKKSAPADVYVFVLKYSTVESEKEYSVNGDLTLIR